MSQSTANVNPVNIPLSPMRVKFNGVDLGGTVDSVTLSIKWDTADKMVDQFGKSVLDKVVSGQNYTVKMVLSEMKNMDNIKVAFPSAKEIVQGGVKSTYVDMQIGDSLLSHAQVLVLHPLANVDANVNEDWTFYKAAAIEVSEIKYGPDKQSGVNVEFVIFPDTGVSPPKFFVYGDTTNGIVHASGGSAAAGANTGNGTIGSIAVYDAQTKTETITVLCVGASSGNDFAVNGSLSGPLGTFHIAAANGSTKNFTASPLAISFTMTQGSIQFAYNDSFTIPTVAANYS